MKNTFDNESQTLKHNYLKAGILLTIIGVVIISLLANYRPPEMTIVKTNAGQFTAQTNNNFNDVWSRALKVIFLNNFEIAKTSKPDGYIEFKTLFYSLIGSDLQGVKCSSDNGATFVSGSAMMTVRLLILKDSDSFNNKVKIYLSSEQNDTLLTDANNNRYLSFAKFSEAYDKGEKALVATCELTADYQDELLHIIGGDRQPNPNSKYLAASF